MSTSFKPCRHRLASLKATRCSECGLPLTLGAISRHYGQRFTGWLHRNAVIACPHCGGTASLCAKTCPHCFDTITVQASVKASLRPARQRWHGVRTPLMRICRVLAQCIYFLSSVALLGWQLPTIPVEDALFLCIRMVISAELLTFLALILIWVLPRDFLAAVAVRVTAVVKLTLVFNYLSLLLLVESCLQRWTSKSLILAGLLASTWIACRFLHRMVWPVVVGIRQILRGEAGTPFDPSQPQGRQGGFE